MFLARLEADVRSIGLGLETIPLFVREPGLTRLVTHLAIEFPPGAGHRLAREAGETIFGETPLSTAYRILRDVAMKPGQRLTELGCGPGRLSLVGAACFGLRCEALDRVPAFVQRGNRLARRLGLAVDYRLAELMHWTPTGEDSVYVAGTAFSPRLRQRLAAALEATSTTVISVSSPIGIAGHESSRLGGYRFPWGREDVFLERRRR